MDCSSVIKWRSLCFFRVVFLIWVLGFPLKAVVSVSSDKSVLLQFKDSVSDPSGLLSSWKSSNSDHCSWLGVTCDSGSRVLSLNNCTGGNVKLIGTLSPVIAKLTELRALSLPYNEFGGQIPIEIWGMEKLEVLDLEGNSMSGSLPIRFGGLRNSRILNLAGNMVNGTIPGFIGSFKELRGDLDLSGNLLVGGIPSSLGNCSQLRSILLFSNLLEEVIPAELGQLRNLEVLDNMKGDSNSGQLVSGNDDYNYFQGTIPVEITTLPKLRIIWAPRATLEGRFPSNWGACDSLEQTVYSFLAGENNLTGPFPRNLFDKCYGLNRVVVNVSNNRISGQLPTEIGALCKTLTLLDASGNQINGSIPHSIGNLVSLVALNLSSNHLQGEIPSRSPTRSRSSSFNSIEIASITSASAIVSVLLALVVLFIYTRKCNPKSRILRSARKEVTVFNDIGVPLTFENVVRATGSFNASNCIGNGGFGATYKAEISPGVLVAIKRLAVGRFQGVQQFHAEVKTLGRLDHPNLVTLIGYHASETEMFLIYNYLPGGNLEKFIQERSTRAVDWRKALDPSFSSYGNGFNIVAWGCMLLRQGRAKEFFTAGLWDAGPHDDLVEVLHLAVVCTVDSLSTRPTMRQVVRRLKQLQPPSSPKGSG
ncbi:unnamed protein product, partial [Vitis vinifera]